MRKLGLRGVRRGGWKKPRTTVPDPSQDRPADLVNRDFAPDAPDRLWVVDFTFVATRAGTAYTAFVIDAFARLIAGWRTAASHSTDLVLDALVMAVTYRARQGVKVAGLIHHSDAGSEYLSIRYGAELAAAGIAPSVGSVGDSYDNALAECGHRPVQDRGHRPPGAMGNPRPGRGRHQRMGQLVQHRAGDAAHRGPPAGRIRAGLARRHARPGPRPRAGQQAPPARTKEAAMAAAHYPGGLRPHPPGLRPGPRPSSEMPRQVRTGAAAGGHLLAGRGTGATEPPPRSRAPPASQAMTLRVTLDQPGEPAAQKRGARRGDARAPAGGLAGGARHQAGQLDSAAGQMFDKTKAEK